MVLISCLNRSGHMLLDTMLMLAMLSVGLFAGLMMTLVVIMQRQWDTLEKNEYVNYFKGFLIVAKGNRVISILTLASFVLPAVIGIIHLNSGNNFQGTIMISAGVVFFIGCFGVTLWLNFPIYDKVIAWEEAEFVRDWEDVRKRFHKLNVIRMTFAIVSFLILGISGLF
jgi:uncharacterized membrane protein